MLNAKSIANYFLDLAKASGEQLDPMKLQKLIYYAHGWYAGYKNEPLINETVEAWPFGPVVSSVYHEFKRYGASPIKEKAKDFIGGQYCIVPPPSNPSIITFLNNVWQSYGKYTGVKLSEMTHTEGSPWHQAISKNPGVRGADIPFEVIAKHFKEVIEKARERTAQA